MAKPITPDEEYKPGNQTNGLTVGPAGLPVQFKVGQQAMSTLPQALAEQGGALTILPQGQNQVEDFGVTVPGKATYWENPQRVARYSNAFRSGDIEQAPPWLDKTAIDTAYKYLQFRNEGKPWYRWQPLAEDDPGTAYLRSITAPPAEVMPDWEQKDAEWSLQDPYAPAETTPTTFGVPDTEWDALPWWQKGLIPLMSSGTGFGAALGLATGGYPGAAIGAVLGTAGEAAAKNPNALGSKLFNLGNNALDAPAEGLERMFGMATQLGYSAIKPDEYGSVGDILKNLPAAWQASTMLYTAFPTGGPVNQLNYLRASLTPGNDFQAKVWNLGSPQPVMLNEDQIGIAAMAETRNRLAAINNGSSNETLSSVLYDMQNRFGFTGQSQELVGHMVLDPLNLLPAGLASVAGDLAKVTSNPMLSAAVKIGQGEPLQTVKAYQQAIRQAPVDELTKFEKWLGGVTVNDEGRAVLKWQQEPNKTFDPKSGKLWINDLTPQSKAVETTVMFRDNLNQMISDTDNVDDIQKMIHIAANGTPQEVAQVTQNSWLNSAEGGVFPLMAREHVKFVDEFSDAYRISDTKRTMLNNIADILQITPTKMLEGIDVKSADDLVKMLGNKLSDMAKTGDAKAADLLRSITDPADPMTGTKLYNIASDFKKGNFPLTFDEFKYKLIDLLSERVENSAVKWFGVKQNPFFVRLSNTVKSAQSLVLLGLNPSYLINNIVNNIATMAHSGVLSFDGAGARANLVSRMEIDPTRMNIGLGSAEIGDAAKAGYTVGSVASKATKPAKADNLTKLDDILKSTANKFGFATKYSARVEQWSSEIAYSTAMRNAFRNMWNPETYGRLDGVMESAMRNIGVDPSTLYRAVNGTMNHKEIDDVIANGYKLDSLDRALSPETKELFSQLGIYDALTEKLQKATTKNEIVRAIDDTRKQAFDAIDKKMRANLAATEEATFNRVKGEGVQAVLEQWDRLWMEHGEFWMAHQDDMGHVFEVANQLTGKNRSKYLSAKLQESEKKWKLQWDNQGSKIQGAVKALSEAGDSVTTEKATGILINQQQNWAVFYDNRSKLWNLYSEVKHGANKGALVELNRMLGEIDDSFVPITDINSLDIANSYYAQINTALGKMYRDHLSIESGLQVEMDALFVDLFGRQFENADAAAAWRSGILNLREQMAEANVYFRTGDASGLMNFGDERLALKAQIDAITGGRAVQDLLPDERHQMYRAFNDQIVKPMEARYAQENSVNASKMAQVPPREVPIPPRQTTPGYQEMPAETVLTKVPGMLLRAYMDAEGYRDPRHMINAYNKYMQPENKITRLDELSWGDMQKMTDARKEIKATEAVPQQNELANWDDIIEIAKMRDMRFSDNDIKSYVKKLKASGKKYVEAWHITPAENIEKINTEGLKKNLSPFDKHDRPSSLYFITDKDDIKNSMNYFSSGQYAVVKFFMPIDDLVDVKPDFPFNMSFDVKTSFRIEKDIPTKQIESYEIYDLSHNKDTQTSKLTKVEPVKVEPEPVKPQTPEPEAVKMPLGEVEKYLPAPIDDATFENWNKMVDPALRDLEGKMISGEGMQATGGIADQIRTGVKQANPGMSDADVETAVSATMKEMRKWVAGVKQKQNDVRLASQKWGQEARDFALLNYGRRTNFDTLAGMVFPYEFWYTRSMINWAMRALDKPALFANYTRLKEFQENVVEHDGFPTRLRNKIGIKLPFLPDWMGEGVFIDPYRAIYPFSQFGRPFNEMAEQNNLIYKKTISTLQYMASEEEISPADAQAAIDAGSGELWEKAKARAMSDIDLEIANPFDAISLMYGPSLPIQYAYQLAMGRPERISQLPITRGVQAVTGALGIGGPAGVNLFGKVRKAAGLPEVDRYYDYRVNRMLASMTAMGEIGSHDAQVAMVEKQGPAYDEARRKVAKIGFWQYVGSPLGVDFFPEGEQEQRALQAEYNNAMTAWKNGDDNAKTAFFDKYPEFEAQQLAWKNDPEEQLRYFLRAEVWDGWNKLSDLHKDQAKEQLGSTFTDAFLTKATRSYDSIDTETYATWANMLGGDAAGVKTAQMQLDLADKAISDKTQAFYDERDKLFPDIGVIYSLPEAEQAKYQDKLDEYTQWRQNYIAANPQIAQYVTSEQSNLYGLPQEVQAYVYQFRADRDTKYPGIFDTQTAYYNLSNSAQKKSFLKQHPELSQYWDMRTQWASDMPTAAPYILSEESLRNRITGDSGTTSAVTYNKPAAQPVVTAQDLEGFDPALTRQLFGWAFTGESLSLGARKELRRQWELAGEPGGDFEKYLIAVKGAVNGH